MSKNMIIINNDIFEFIPEFTLENAKQLQKNTDSHCDLCNRIVHSSFIIKCIDCGKKHCDVWETCASKCAFCDKDICWTCTVRHNSEWSCKECEKDNSNQEEENCDS